MSKTPKDPKPAPTPKTIRVAGGRLVVTGKSDPKPKTDPPKADKDGKSA